MKSTYFNQDQIIKAAFEGHKPIAAAKAVGNSAQVKMPTVQEGIYSQQDVDKMSKVALQTNLVQAMEAFRHDDVLKIIQNPKTIGVNVKDRKNIYELAMSLCDFQLIDKLLELNIPFAETVADYKMEQMARNNQAYLDALKVWEASREDANKFPRSIHCASQFFDAYEQKDGKVRNLAKQPFLDSEGGIHYLPPAMMDPKQWSVSTPRGFETLNPSKAFLRKRVLKSSFSGLLSKMSQTQEGALEAMEKALLFAEFFAQTSTDFFDYYHQVEHAVFGRGLEQKSVEFYLKAWEQLRSRPMTEALIDLINHDGVLDMVVGANKSLDKEQVKTYEDFFGMPAILVLTSGEKLASMVNEADDEQQMSQADLLMKMINQHPGPRAHVVQLTEYQMQYNKERFADILEAPAINQIKAKGGKGDSVLAVRLVNEKKIAEHQKMTSFMYLDYKNSAGYKEALMGNHEALLHNVLQSDNPKWLKWLNKNNLPIYMPEYAGFTDSCKLGPLVYSYLYAPQNFFFLNQLNINQHLMAHDALLEGLSKLTINEVMQVINQLDLDLSERVNKNGDTLLHFWAHQGHNGIKSGWATLLSEYPSMSSMQNKQGQTAVDIQRKKLHKKQDIEAFDKLLANKENVALRKKIKEVSELPNKPSESVSKMAL